MQGFAQIDGVGKARHVFVDEPQHLDLLVLVFVYLIGVAADHDGKKVPRVFCDLLGREASIVPPVGEDRNLIGDLDRLFPLARQIQNLRAAATHQIKQTQHDRKVFVGQAAGQIAQQKQLRPAVIAAQQLENLPVLP